MIADASLKESMSMQGFSVIDYNDQTYFVLLFEEEAVLSFYNSLFPDKNVSNIDDVCSDDSFRKIIRLQKRYKWFRERSGERRHVLYDSEMYEKIRIPDGRRVIHAIQRDNQVFYLPVNCSSCYYMFWKYQFSADAQFCKGFDKGTITEMYGMFHEASFPSNFLLERSLIWER